jgi:O-succinylbenzoic acid--CoA ligase
MLTGLVSLPHHNAVAVAADDVTLLWSDILARCALPATSSSSSSSSSSVPMARVATPELGTVLAICAALFTGTPLVLAHHRWPAAMVDDAFELANARRPWPHAGLPLPTHATVLFTSGSTGRPKAVVHDVQAHLDNARGALSVMPFAPGDRWLLSLPLGHVGGLAVLMRALVGGGAVVLPPSSSRSLCESIVRTKPTHLSLVAAQLQQIVVDRDAVAVLQQAKDILVGGGPTAPAVLQRAVELGLPVRQTWGMTEMGSQVCTSARGHVATCGSALPGRFVRLGDDGEIFVGGAGRCAGFVDHRTFSAPFEHDGAYATGDLGAFVDDGVGGVGLVLTGRKGNRFISGGENIQPEAIEAALGDSDTQTVVVPVPDARFGLRPFCFFAANVDDEAHISTLRARADERLPRFMHPVRYARLPDTGGLKPRRGVLTDLAAALMKESLT